MGSAGGDAVFLRRPPVAAIAALLLAGAAQVAVADLETAGRLEMVRTKHRLQIRPRRPGQTPHWHAIAQCPDMSVIEMLYGNPITPPTGVCSPQRLPRP